MALDETRFALSRPSYEFLLHQFKRGGGLFLVGAGASTGITPFGNAFLAAPGLHYLDANSGDT